MWSVRRARGRYGFVSARLQVFRGVPEVNKGCETSGPGEFDSGCFIGVIDGEAKNIRIYWASAYSCV